MVPACVRCPCAKKRSYDECRLLSLTEPNSALVPQLGCEGGREREGERKNERKRRRHRQNEKERDTEEEEFAAVSLQMHRRTHRGETASIAKLTILYISS